MLGLRGGQNLMGNLGIKGGGGENLKETMDPFSPFQGKEISRKSACHFFVFLDLYRCVEFRKRLMS